VALKLDRDGNFRLLNQEPRPLRRDATTILDETECVEIGDSVFYHKAGCTAGVVSYCKVPTVKSPNGASELQRQLANMALCLRFFIFFIFGVAVVEAPFGTDYSSCSCSRFITMLLHKCLASSGSVVS
jgi:hypothetical protein